MDDHTTPDRAAMLGYAPKTLLTADLLGSRTLTRQELAAEISRTFGLSKAGANSRIQLAADLGTIEAVGYGVYRRSARYAP